MTGAFDRDLFGNPLRRRYPNFPGHRGVDTSIVAANALASNLGALQSLTLDFIAACGPSGATSDECARGLCIDRLSIRPRTTELSLKGLIIDSGRRRFNVSGKLAIVWIAAESRHELCSSTCSGLGHSRG
jgi:hypothetical protein